MSETSKQLLILDDEESIRQSVAAYLEDDGYTVFEAKSGEEALEIIKNNQIYQAIVDIRLPGMDGNHFMIKARRIRPEIQFTIHTGSADYIPPQSIRDLGVAPESILIKPVRDLELLKNALNK